MSIQHGARVRLTSRADPIAKKYLKFYYVYFSCENLIESPSRNHIKQASEQAGKNLDVSEEFGLQTVSLEGFSLSSHRLLYLSSVSNQIVSSAEKSEVNQGHIQGFLLAVGLC